uniref:Uncharacterized protein n=1 Tax=Picea sitchensis TaxID=3332 RepID=A0A6B9XXV7_PICSI|nr:hypothetical protein Q903MT_gene5461 [Picea sitchensis]
MQVVMIKQAIEFFLVNYASTSRQPSEGYRNLRQDNREIQTGLVLRIDRPKESSSKQAKPSKKDSTLLKNIFTQYSGRQARI